MSTVSGDNKTESQCWPVTIYTDRVMLGHPADTDMFASQIAAL